MDGSVFEEKLSFKILGVTFSSKLDWGTYISIAKTASKKIEVFSMNFNKVSFFEVAVYLYKSTIRHVWNTVVTSGLAPVLATWNC